MVAMLETLVAGRPELARLETNRHEPSAGARSSGCA